MDRLEACYFCGTGDGSLDEYPVVPDALSPSPDEQATVTLCPACRRKLGEVVKRIAAVAESGSVSARDTGPDEASPAPEPSGSTGPATDSGEQSTSAEADTGDEGTADPPDQAAPSEGDDQGATPDTLSPFQYNKVMRLLENRDFPVAVDEFESIATSAYQLEPADVEAVIQAAIDRGLIDRGEDGETLHRAE